MAFNVGESLTFKPIDKSERKVRPLLVRGRSLDRPDNADLDRACRPNDCISHSCSLVRLLPKSSSLLAAVQRAALSLTWSGGMLDVKARILRVLPMIDLRIVAPRDIPSFRCNWHWVTINEGIVFCAFYYCSCRCGLRAYRQPARAGSTRRQLDAGRLCLS
jgi:hypothetical protein